MTQDIIHKNHKINVEWEYCVRILKNVILWSSLAHLAVRQNSKLDACSN